MEKVVTKVAKHAAGRGSIPIGVDIFHEIKSLNLAQQRADARKFKKKLVKNMCIITNRNKKVPTLRKIKICI